MNPGTPEVVARALSSALEPLADALSAAQAEDLFAALGLRFPPAALTQPSVAAPLNAARTAAAALLARRTTLDTAVAGNDATAVVQAGVALLQSVTSLFTALDSLGGAFAALPPASVPGIDAAALADFSANLRRRLLAHALVVYMRPRVPTFAGVLALGGVLENVPSPGGAANPARPAYVRRDLHLERLPDLLTNPTGLLRNLYGWGNATFNSQALLEALAGFLENLGQMARVDSPAPGQFALRSLFVDIVPDTSRTPNGLTGRLHASVGDGVTQTFPLSPRWTTTVRTRGEFAPGMALTIAPPATLILTPPVPNFAGDITAALDWSGTPFVLFGTADQSRLEVGGCSIAAGVTFTPSGATSDARVWLEARLDRGRAVIDTSKGDSFLRFLTGGAHAEGTFWLSGGWTPADGLRFGAGSGPEIAIPVHTRVGPAELQTLYLRFGVEGGALAIEMSAALSASLGPLLASVDRLGVTARVSFPSGGGNLGPANLAIEFKPPTGVGLSLDAGGFKGGGFLRFDQARGEYAGALELDFMGLFSVKAIGIINTKMPDGSPGFSLLILITAEFTPIQLTFGFTLNGIGGIFGLNRTIFVNALAEGIRTNAIKSILFPQDVIANIARIISDIKQFFPQQPDHFVVGPMAKLGWGTPSIITAELGLLLDLPTPMFAIVGVLRAVLPTEEAAILRLQVNFLGVVDLDRGYLFFRADLFESRLLVFAVTGSLAFLVSWGEQQTFALSVGGFHPDFRDIPAIPALPDGFRGMARIGISLLSDDNPRLKVESYFAVTSNTVQFGARAELYAAAAGFNVYGFLGYDVLFQFDPFRFIARLYGGIALREGDDVIAGINVTAQLSGPTPWDARGTATLTILFFDIDIDFHVTWGDPPPAIAPQTEDLLALLQREIADTRNWRADLPPMNHLYVTLRTIEPPEGEAPLVIHPAGVLTFSERAMPLEDFKIDRFGARKPLNENHFKLSGANANGLPIPADYQNVREQFAISQFSDLTDSDKLSRSSFERLPSGFTLTGTSNLQATLPVTREVAYELSYLRRKPVRTTFSGVVKLAARAYERLVKGSAARQSVLAQQQVRTSMNAPPKVVLEAEQYAVASVADLTAYAKAGESPRRFSTQAEAYQHHQQLVERDPALAGQIQVVSHFELAS